MSVPRNSYARKVVQLYGWSDEDAINAIVDIDRVDLEEATRRYQGAVQQQRNRSKGQIVRKLQGDMKTGHQRHEARMHVLATAYHKGRYTCKEDLGMTALTAGWSISDDTGKAFAKICLPLEREGLIRALIEDDHLVGYTITDAGREELLGSL